MLSPRQIALQGFVPGTPVPARLRALQGLVPIPLIDSASGGRSGRSRVRDHREQVAPSEPAKDPRVERNNQIILLMAMAVVSGKIKR